jgi:nucleotide-binding universal stress UspA family protein
MEEVPPGSSVTGIFGVVFQTGPDRASHAHLSGIMGLRSSASGPAQERPPDRRLPTREGNMNPNAASSTEPWRNLLVPLDGSEDYPSILDHARHLLARESLAVTFLRVIECSEDHARDPAYQTDSRHGRDRRILAAARSAFAGYSGTSNAEFRFGDPATEILREIVDGGHDAAILNWHGDRRLGRPHSESVANRVLLSSPVPILYFPAAAAGVGVPPSPLRFEQILVMLDGSPEAEEILPGAERMARTLGSDLHLFQAVAQGAAHRRAADQYLSGLAHALGSRGVVCQVQVRTGPARQTVAELLKECKLDALALATRARSGWTHALLGSLTKELLRGAHVPILTQVTSARRLPIPISGQRVPLRVE